jgi:hypothetical protein
MPPGRRHFSPEEHLSATVKRRFRQNEVIPPSLLDTPRIPLIWRSCTYFPFPLSCSIQQRLKHAGAVSTSSPASLPLQEETDDLELAFELASPSRIALCTPASPEITGASPTCDLWPHLRWPRRKPSPLGEDLLQNQPEPSDSVLTHKIKSLKWGGTGWSDPYNLLFNPTHQRHDPNESVPTNHRQPRVGFQIK